MTTREALYRLIDEIPEERLEDAELALRDVRQPPPLYTLADAPYDDEPFTKEDRGIQDEARRAIAAGEVISHEEMRRLIERGA